MTPSPVDLLLAGRNGDPFALLGPHAAEGGGWEVRAFVPHAAAVTVETEAGATPAEMVREQGYFVARLDAYPGAYRLRVDGKVREDPYRFPLLLSQFDLHLFGEGTHKRAYDFLGAHLMEVEGVEGVRFAVWAPNAAGGERDWRLEPLEREGAPDAAARRRSLGVVPAGDRGGRRLQVQDPHLRRPGAGQGGSVRVPGAAASGDRVGGVRPDAVRVVGPGMDGAPRGDELAGGAGAGLRGASGKLAAEGSPYAAHLPRAGEDAGGLRGGDGLHAHRADADPGASVFGVVGLPGDRVFRSHFPLRDAGRLPVFRGRLPPRRHRGAARLGAGAFPEGRARAGVFRRHGAVRARGSAARRAPRLGDAGVQLRTPRGAEFSAVERGVLVRAVSPGRHARGRGGGDDLSRLPAAAGRVAAEPVRRAGEPGGDRVPEAVQRAGAPVSGGDHGGGGIHGFSGRDQAGVPGRAGVHDEVEHGLDARHVPLLSAGPGVPALPPEQRHVFAVVRLQRELPAAGVARRGGAPEEVAAVQDAGG